MLISKAVLKIRGCKDKDACSGRPAEFLLRFMSYFSVFLFASVIWGAYYQGGFCLQNNYNINPCVILGITSRYKQSKALARFHFTNSKSSVYELLIHRFHQSFILIIEAGYTAFGRQKTPKMRSKDGVVKARLAPSADQLLVSSKMLILYQTWTKMSLRLYKGCKVWR